MKPGSSIARKLARVLARGDLNSTPVTVMWQVPAAPLPTGANPGIESDSTPAPVNQQETITGLVHYVGLNDTGGDTTSRQKFTEIQRGDLLLDLPGTVDFSGKSNIRFRIGGIDYVQKATGGTVAQSWDVRVSGQAVIRTLCLTPLT